MESPEPRKSSKRSASAWQAHTIDFPWSRIWRVHQPHEILPLLAKSRFDHIILEWLQVMVTVDTFEYSTFVQPAKFLRITSILSRTCRQGHATRALEVLKALAQSQGWGLAVPSPFNTASAGWLSKQAKDLVWFTDRVYGVFAVRNDVPMQRQPGAVDWWPTSSSPEASILAHLCVAQGVPLPPLHEGCGIPDSDSGFVSPPAVVTMAAAAAAPKKARVSKLPSTAPDSVFMKCAEEIQEVLKEDDDKLYPHQRRAASAIRQYFSRAGSTTTPGVVVLPTGSGKTGVAVLAAYALAARRVLVLTPSHQISKQVLEAFRGTSKDPKLLKDDTPHDAFLVERQVFPKDELQEQLYLPTAALIKKSRQIKDHRSEPLLIFDAFKVTERATTKVNNLPSDYDLVIVDEAHHYPAPTWADIVARFPESRKLFLTATAERDGQPLPGVQVIHQEHRAQLVQAGIIREFDAFAEEPGPLDEDREVVFQVRVLPFFSVSRIGFT